jgi:type II secretory pathway component PulF
MATKMIACPHCGTENSERKQRCFACEKPLGTARVPRATKTPAPAPVRPRLPAIARAPRTPAQARPIARGPGIVGVTLKQRVQIYRQIEHLLKAGIPIGQSLTYLQDNVARYLRPMVKDMADSAHRGEQVWQTMERYHTVFAEWEVSVVRAAEKGGNLPEAMAGIAETLEMEMEMRYQVGVKLLPLYATFFVFILVLLIVFSVGRAEQGNVISVFNQVGYAFLRFVSIVTAIILLRFAWRFYSRSLRGARVAQAIVTRMPLIGPILHLQMLYRFVQVLGALWRAGVSPMESLESAARASNNSLMKHRVGDQLKRVGEGATLSEALAATRVFPQEIIYMVQSGETSGAVSETLDRVAQYIRMELDAQLKTLPIRAQLAMYVLVGIPAAIFIIWFWTSYYASALGGG